jgi:hypothetical protein
MKRKTLFALAALVCTASIIAQGFSYTAEEAAKHVGQTTTITGTVDGVHQSGKGNIFLNMGGTYPKPSPLLFHQRARRSFPILSSTKAEQCPCRAKSLSTKANRKSSSTRLRRSAQNEKLRLACASRATAFWLPVLF